MSVNGPMIKSGIERVYPSLALMVLTTFFINHFEACIILVIDL